MTAPLADLARQFHFNHRLLQRFAGDLEAEEWARPASEQGGNRPHWILGHLARSRRGLLRRLGVELPEEPWEPPFARGAEPGDGTYRATVADLLTDFARSDEALGRRLPELAPEQAAEPWETGFPDGAETLEQGIRFLHFHECYHLGQLGLMRRLVGRESIP